MPLADLWRDSKVKRQEEIEELKQQVKQWKKQIKIERSLVQKELNIQAQETRQTLSNFIAGLQQQGDEDRKQRQQDKEKRQQQVSDRKQEVSQLIEEFANKREKYRVQLDFNARILAEELQDFHHNLQSRVWEVNTGKSTPKSSSEQTGVSETVKPTQNSPTPDQDSSSESKTKEEQIYEFVKQSEGISLIEIEKQFAIKRKRTIELIRKLIQEGMIEQRDRLYFVCSS